MKRKNGIGSNQHETKPASKTTQLGVRPRSKVSKSQTQEIVVNGVTHRGAPHRNPDGSTGGFVSERAWVCEASHVGSSAKVLGDSLIERSKVTSGVVTDTTLHEVEARGARLDSVTASGSTFDSVEISDSRLEEVTATCSEISDTEASSTFIDNSVVEDSQLHYSALKAVARMSSTDDEGSVFLYGEVHDSRTRDVRSTKTRITNSKLSTCTFENTTITRRDAHDLVILD